MIRRPPRSTLDRSSAASDVYKRQADNRPAAGARRGCRPDPAARPHGPGRVRATGPDAVSYTHLRAHETVLDLVCRLLLEKKHYDIRFLTPLTKPPITPLDASFDTLPSTTPFHTGYLRRY